MAAQSTISPMIMEFLEDTPTGSASASPADGIPDKQLKGLRIKKGSSSKKKSSPPSPSLTIQPAPYFGIPTPVFSSAVLGAPNHERSYLLESLRRQQQRGERLTHALSNVEVRLASAHSKSEGKKLRQEANQLRGKISESHRQEQLIMLRLNDIQNEDLGRMGLYQAQPAVMASYQMAWGQYSPWGSMMLSPSGISPLTPLPPGLYHPSPIAPSPLTSPYWLGVQHSIPSAISPTDTSYYIGQPLQTPLVPAGAVRMPARRASMASITIAKDGAPIQTSTEPINLQALTQQGPSIGRRWSLADTFSPEPRDKRMSMPALQTIWKDRQPEVRAESTSRRGSRNGLPLE